MTRLAAAGTAASLKITVRLLLLASLLAVTVRYAIRAADAARKDYGEGPLLAMVQRMQQEPISRRWLAEPPYTLTCYGPGCYGAFLIASHAVDDRGSLYPGRLLVLAATLATAALVALAVHKHHGGPEAAAFGGLVFLGSSIVASWVPYQRVDMLAVPFAVAAYVAADRWRRGYLLSAVLIAVGSLVKQTVAFAALPVAVYLLLGRRYRDAGATVVLVAVLGVGLWWVVDAASGGYFFTAALGGNLNRIVPAQGARLALGFLQCPAVLAAALLLGWLVKRRPREAAGSLFCVALVLSSLLAAATACKEGASINYFLEPCALAAIVLGVHGLPRLGKAHPRRTLIAMGLLAALIAVPGVGEFPSAAARARRLPPLEPRVAQLLRSSAGAAVLADGRWIDTVLSAGAVPAVNDPFLMRLMADNGTLDPGALLRAIESGQVRWALLSRPIEEHRRAIGSDVQRWPSEILDALERHGRCVVKAPGQSVYILGGSPEPPLGHEIAVDRPRASR